MRAFLFLAAALAAVVSPGVTSVTHREATNIVKAVAYTKDEADGKYLTTNLVGKTVVTGTNTVLKMGAGTRVNGTDDMYIQLGGGELIFPDNLGITVRGNRTLATWGITNGCTKAEVDAALAGKLDRIVRNPQYAYNHSEFKQTLDGLEYIEYQTEDGQTEVISRASFGSKMVYATEDSNWLTAGIHASEDYLGFGISQSASAFKNGSFSIFYGNGFIGIGNNEITIPNATGTMALRSTTLAGYGIGDAYTKAQTDAAITAKVGGCIPKTGDERVEVGPLVIGAEPVLLGFGVYSVSDPWRKSTWGIDPSSMYTEADWHFSDTVHIGPDGLDVFGINHLTFVIGNRWVSFSDTVKELITPAVVLEKIKAMDATQKAELKAFLGIQ